MLYLWLKTFHILAVITWIGGMLVLAVAMAALSTPPRSAEATGAFRSVQAWDRAVTNPALGLVWVLGLTIAVLGGWFSAPWLHAKLAVVVILSALHGMQSGALRRMIGAPERPPPAILRFAAPVTLAGVALVVALVVTKPF